MKGKDPIIEKCTAGKSLELVSIILLILGITSSVIIFFTEAIDRGWYSVRFSWIGFIYSISVLATSIIFYIVGKTIAKTANYSEAIYKKCYEKVTKNSEDILIKQSSNTNDSVEYGINWDLFSLVFVVLAGIIVLLAALF